MQQHNWQVRLGGCQLASLSKYRKYILNFLFQWPFIFKSFASQAVQRPACSLQYCVVLSSLCPKLCSRASLQNKFVLGCSSNFVSFLWKVHLPHDPSHRFPLFIPPPSTIETHVGGGGIQSGKIDTVLQELVFWPVDCLLFCSKVEKFNA